MIAGIGAAGAAGVAAVGRLARAAAAAAGARRMRKAAPAAEAVIRGVRVGSAGWWLGFSAELFLSAPSPSVVVVEELSEGTSGRGAEDEH